MAELTPRCNIKRLTDNLIIMKSSTKQEWKTFGCSLYTHVRGPPLFTPLVFYALFQYYYWRNSNW